MTETQNTVLALAAASVFDTPIRLPRSTDWQAVFGEIKKQNLVALTFAAAEKAGVPAHILDAWAKERDRTLFHSARNIGAHLGIHRLLTDAGIPYVILKGVASASYYPNYLLRTYGDVDFIVSDKDYRRTADLLLSHGYVYCSEHAKHKVYEKDHIIYELHRRIVGIPGGDLRMVFENYFSDIMESATSFRHDNAVCRIPSDKHHAVILLIHTAEHMGTTGIGIRQLLDWAVFADKKGSAFFAEEMQDVLKEMGIWRYCRILTALCTKYLGLQAFDWADGTDAEYLEKLMKDVFSSGEFGHVYSEKIDASNRGIAPLGKVGGRGALQSFFLFVHRKAKELPPVERFPILLPLGWIYICLRYLLKIARGKRSFKLARKTIIQYGEKNGLRQEWHLFERE